MKDSARYAKIVDWSDKDHCYVGSSPGLIYGGTHGDNEKAIELYRNEGKPLPSSTSGRNFANEMQQVARFLG